MFIITHAKFGHLHFPLQLADIFGHDVRQFHLASVGQFIWHQTIYHPNTLIHQI